MIEGIRICKSFGTTKLFSDLNFEINDGDFICFSGESGAGKTTLLNIIGLIEPIDSGKLLFDGQEYNNRKQKLEFYRSKVGFLFQNFALIENKTVYENLEIISPKCRTNYSITDVLSIVGLESKINQKIYTLSGGEQQRIALARLFLKKCKIILADEPTGSLDKRNAQIIMNTLFELNGQGKTVIMVTHDNEIKKMTRRVIEIS